MLDALEESLLPRRLHPDQLAAIMPTWISARAISFWLFVIALLVAPMALGSNRDWAWSPLAVALGIICLLHAGAILQNGEWHGPPLTPLLPVAAAFILVVLWAVFQLYFLAVPERWKVLSVQPWFQAGSFGFAIVGGDVETAVEGLMSWLTYGAAFFFSTMVAWRTERARLLLATLIVAAVVITSYALAAEAAATAKGELALLLPKFGQEFSGTFVNRNNYATFAGLGGLATIALLQLEGPIRRDAREPYRTVVRRVLVRLGGTSGLLIACFTVLATGVVMSGSRAGTFAFAVAVLVSWIISRRRSFATAVVVCLLAIFLVSLPGSTLLLTRLFALSGAIDPRAELYQMTLDAIAVRPWTGWGVGSFEPIYSILQPPSLMLNFDKAHNTYLELALELGIPFAAIYVSIVALIIARCVIGLAARSRNRVFPGLAIWASVLVGVHSLFDFSVQIPAVAVSFSMLLGVGWAQSWSSRTL